MSDDIVYSFAIPKEAKKKLEDISESEHRTLAGQLRLIIEEYLKEQK